MAEWLKDFAWDKWLLLFGFAFVIIQTISWLIGLYVPAMAVFARNASVLWLFLILLAGISIAYVLIFRSFEVSKSHVLILLIVLFILIYLFLKLSPLLPSIFDSQSIMAAANRLPNLLP